MTEKPICGLLAGMMALWAGIAAAGDRVITFEKGDAGCTFENFRNRLDVSVGAVDGVPAVVFRNVDSPERDVKWGVTTPRFQVREGVTFAVVVKAMGDICNWRLHCPQPKIAWYCSDGRPLTAIDAENRQMHVSHPIDVIAGKDTWNESRTRGVVPVGAAFGEIVVSMDRPDLERGKLMAISEIAYHERPDGAAEWMYDDLDAPELVMLTPSPNADTNAPIVFRLKDASGIDLSRFRCRVEGRDVTAELESADGVWTYRPKRPWRSGSVVSVKVDCGDRKGNFGEDFGFLCLTDTPVVHERVSVRDDGMLELGGKPFFLLGVYSVCPAPLHGKDVRQSVRILSEAGFNACTTYMVRGRGRSDADYDALFEACAERGMKVIAYPSALSGVRHEELMFANMVDGRGRKALLSWCIGDDTGGHRSPWELKRDWRAMQAIDPMLITSQADCCRYAGRAAPYVPYAPCFLCESYPMRKAEAQPDELAKFEQDMRLAVADYRMAGASPCIVALPQAFSGWSWERYPSYEEVRVQAFLAIACGARGVCYYTYYSTNGSGAASDSGHFAELCRVSREVSGLLPDLVTRDAAVQPTVEIVEGPALNMPGGRPSVSCLLKSTGLLVAVNTASEPVVAKLTLPDGRVLTRRFARAGVHVERVPARRVGQLGGI